MKTEFSYAIIFDSQATKDLICLVNDVLVDNGFRIYKDQNSDNCTVFYLELEDFKQFLYEAEYLKVELIKPFKRSMDIDSFDVLFIRYSRAFAKKAITIGSRRSKNRLTKIYSNLRNTLSSFSRKG